MTSPLRLLMTTQALDQDHPILGFSHTWAAKLAQRVQSLHIIALSVGEHHLPNNVVIHSLGKERGVGRAGKFLNFQRAIAPLAFKGGIDGIFVQQTEINAILAAPYARLLGVPLVLFKGHGRSLRPSLRIANHLIDRALTSTEVAYPIDTPKKTIIGQGIDVDVFHPNGSGHDDAGPKRLIAVGRLSPIKNYEFQIEAVKHLVEQRPNQDFVLSIYGGPDSPGYQDKLMDMIKSHHLQEFVHLKGARDFRAIPEIVRSAYALVHTSETLSLDKVVLEAMACGRPAVTSMQCFQEVMGEHATGLIARPDDPADLASKIRAVLDMPESQYQAMGQQLRETVVKDHSVDHLADQVVAIIQELRKKRDKDE